MKNISSIISCLFVLNACVGNDNTSTKYPINPDNLLGINDMYKCLPSDPKTQNQTLSSRLKIAYGSNCQVSNVDNANLKSNLQGMAVAITDSSGERYCTGTPLTYNQDTQIGYVLTAAHCVVGNPKGSGQQITFNNITIFSKNKNYINQTLNASEGSGTTGTVQAVYVPKQYCQSTNFSTDTAGEYGCSYMPYANGDIALLKVSFNDSQLLNINSQIKLAPADLAIPFPSYIMALGYGFTNYDTPELKNTNLIYITYEYFANNIYQNDEGMSVILNGYSPYGSNSFYSIICQGDSGGGDFYWDGKFWNLLGAHSYGSSYICGIASPNFIEAGNASADVRPFADKLQQIMKEDTTKIGCNATESEFVCNHL